MPSSNPTGLISAGVSSISAKFRWCLASSSP